MSDAVASLCEAGPGSQWAIRERGPGEVEDYRFRIDPRPGQTGEMDWGDAPDFAGTILQYPTRASHNGARHTVMDGFRLGRTNDPEPDGQPTILADGDDNNGVPDDEDGVFFLDPLIPGNPARIQVDMQSPSGLGRLDAWIDWQADGNWNQAIDRVFPRLFRVVLEKRFHLFGTRRQTNQVEGGAPEQCPLR